MTLEVSAVELRINCRAARYGAIPALDSFELRFPKGITVVMGDSGAGKTTLLNVIAGMHREFDGEVTLNGHALSTHDPGTLAYVQQSADDVLPWLTSLGNVRLPGQLLNSDEITGRADGLLQHVGLTAKRDSLSSSLSGGEKARVSLARAFVTQPQLLIIDETTSSLHQRLRLEIYDYLRALASPQENIVLCTMHDVDDAVYCADRVAILRGGPSGGKIHDPLLQVTLPDTRTGVRATPEFRDCVNELERSLG